MLPVDEQMRLLMRGVEYGDEQIRAAMEQELRERLAEGRPLRVYLGVDPSAPDSGQLKINAVWGLGTAWWLYLAKHRRY